MVFDVSPWCGLVFILPPLLLVTAPLGGTVHMGGMLLVDVLVVFPALPPSGLLTGWLESVPRVACVPLVTSVGPAFACSLLPLFELMLNGLVYTRLVRCALLVVSDLNRGVVLAPLHDRRHVPCGMVLSETHPTRQGTATSTSACIITSSVVCAC